MTFDWTTFLLQLVNVLILLAILRRYMFRPVADIIAKRQAATDAALERAKAATDAAEAAEAKAHAEAQATARARHDELAKAHTEAETARAALLDKARAEAAKIVASGEVERQRQAAVAEALALGRVRELSATVAALALAAQPASLQDYATRLAAALGDMPDTEREALLSGGNLRLLSAAPLSAAELNAARAALAPFGLTPRAETDPDLISGLELRSDSGVLRNSLRHDLDLITKALQDDRPPA